MLYYSARIIIHSRDDSFTNLTSSHSDNNNQYLYQNQCFQKQPLIWDAQEKTSWSWLKEVPNTPNSAQMLWELCVLKDICKN